VRDQATEPIARELSRRGLAAPALLLLEAHRPIRPLLAIGATFLLPIARPLLGAAATRLAGSLEDDEAFDALVLRLRREVGG
jgi:hypothetical protein